MEKTTALGRQLVRLDWDRVVLPKLAWLIKIGVPVTELGDYLTRNPYFLIQNLDDMKVLLCLCHSRL